MPPPSLWLRSLPFNNYIFLARAVKAGEKLGRGDWGTASLISPSRVSLPRKGHRVGLRIDLFEACSAFTRVTACTLALSPYFVTRLSEGFSHFVSSTAAPVASGWSRCRVGLAPTGKRHLCTAHTHSRHWQFQKADLQCTEKLALVSVILTSLCPVYGFAPSRIAPEYRIARSCPTRSMLKHLQA